MPLGKPVRYRLTPKATSDLESIWLYSAETWSADQADRYTDDLERIFEMLAAMPTMARERTEFVPPVRLHVHGRHLIVYTVNEAGIAILRILGSDQDWQVILAAID